VTETLPDPQASQAVLIGVANYVVLEPLPAVGNNLSALQAVLTDRQIWGLPEENCRLVREPQTADTVFDILQSASNLATDTLVFYFAGHGLVDVENDDELYLALPGSYRERVYRTALPYSWIRRELQSAKARRKVIILDCCYSGRAIGRMGDSEQIADLLEIEGTCVLTATARTRRALAPIGEHFTAFTGELIATLQDGIPDGPDLLDMDIIYRYLTLRLRSKGLPEPDRGAFNLGGDIALARNSQFRRPEVAERTVAEDETVAEQEAVLATLSPIHEHFVPGRSESVVEQENAGNASDLVAAPGISVEPTPEPVPITGAWRQQVDPGRRLTLSPTATNATTRLARRLSVTAILLAGWFSYAAWLAATREPSEWLWAGAAVGWAAVTCQVFTRASRYGCLGSTLRFASSVLSLTFLGLYAVSTFIGNTGDFLSRQHLIELPWIVGAVLLMAIPLGSARRASIGLFIYQNDRAERSCAEAAQHTRWLTETSVAETDARLLDSLYAIPAARFAAVPGEFARFLVVAGNRTLLVLSAPGESTADNIPPVIPAEAIKLRKRLGVHSARVIVLLDSADEPDEPSAPYRNAVVKGDIVFVARNDFADVAGSYLISQAATLNGSTLKLVYHALKTTSMRVAAIRADGPAPVSQLNSGVGSASDVGDDWVEVDSHRDIDLPGIDSLDSVAASALRHAESLRSLGKALDTRNVFLALTRVHLLGSWERIWVACGQSPESIGRQTLLTDPVDHPREEWNDTRLTSTCADAFRTAGRIASRYNLPISPGVLALGLISNPVSAAAKALGVGETIEHDELKELIQSEVLGLSEMRDSD
jgi:hypothetical protein